MARSLSQLLPAPKEAVRCAEHARSIAADPGGTAIRADRIVLVATPLPWPKPALHHPLLNSLREVLASSSTPTRLLASLAAVHPSAGDDTEVTVYQRVNGSATEQRYQVANTDQLVDLGRALIAADTIWLERHLIGSADPARPAVLICTQGSHDVCCGSEGSRLAEKLEAEPDLTVHRVSHTGGHRFAPTAMTLPDGRMWANLDFDLVARILAAPIDDAGAGGAGDLASRCRGWWGADVGPAQVAERAVFAEQGWAFNHEQRQVTVGEVVDGMIPCTVLTTSVRWRVEVVEGRTVPTIACRQPGGLPAKPSHEYDVVSLRLT